MSKCYILSLFPFLSLSLPQTHHYNIFLEKNKSLTSKYWTYLNFWSLRYWKICDNSNLVREYGRRRSGWFVDYKCKENRKEHKNVLQTLSPHFYLTSQCSFLWLESLSFSGKGKTERVTVRAVIEMEGDSPLQLV